MTVTRTQAPRLPALARTLGTPIWQQGQERMRTRYGFDLAVLDALTRARGLVATNDDAEAHLLLASVLATRGNNQEALVEAREALRLDATSARVRTTLATVLVHAGEVAAGLEHARAAAELDPGDAQVLYNLGLAEYTAGDTVAADNAFRGAAALLGISPAPRWQIWRR